MADAQPSGRYQIGALAKQTGVSPDAIRFYERLGLLPRPSRSSGGFRLYTREAVDRLRFIAQAKSLDLSLEEIRTLVAFDARQGLRQCRQMRNVLASKLVDIERKLAELHELHQTLSASLASCDATLTIDAVQACPVVEALDTQNPPANLPRRGRTSVTRPRKKVLRGL